MKIPPKPRPNADTDAGHPSAAQATETSGPPVQLQERLLPCVTAVASPQAPSLQVRFLWTPKGGGHQRLGEAPRTWTGWGRRQAGGFEGALGPRAGAFRVWSEQL